MRLQDLDVPLEIKKQAFPAVALYMVFCIFSVAQIHYANHRSIKLLQDTAALKEQLAAKQQAEKQSKKAQ